MNIDYSKEKSRVDSPSAYIAEGNAASVKPNPLGHKTGAAASTIHRSHRFTQADLSCLRQQGLRRSRWFLHNRCSFQYHHPRHLDCCCSTSLRRAWDAMTEGDCVLDLGCGESADRLIVKEWGYEAIGVDLFPINTTPSAGFIQANGLDLPFKDYSFDIVLCHAMIDLVNPVYRPALYQEILRVLKLGGMFFFEGLNLSSGGYGYGRQTEHKQIIAAGFHMVQSGMYQQCDGNGCWC